MELDMTSILMSANDKGASDIHFVVGRPPMFRIYGKLFPMEDAKRLMPDDVKELAASILTEAQEKIFDQKNELDFSFGIAGIGRYRVNLHMQRGTVGITIRSLSTTIPDFEVLNIYESVKNFIDHKNGLVVVTGPTGSGKSTTLASLLDKVNRERKEHIITVEDPIEYLHMHKESLVEQREIGTDTESFSTALKYALRQDPDIILIGEMRDLETITAALSAAETGHLVFGTLHTNDASKTIDRIIDVFPTEQQSQVRVQLSTSLRGVLAQQLVPTVDGKRRAACEVLVGTPAIGNLIREGKTHQIPSMIETGARHGMISMDASLKKLFNEGLISREEFEKRSKNKLGM